eukprot:scaffold1193_cov159-Ochromonas_danica.AAC.12
MKRLDKEEIIDATCVGGMARFINHCCEPNAYARVISCTEDGGDDDEDDDGEVNHHKAKGGATTSKHIVIIAGRDIAEGEEITYDYKFPLEETKLACFCGAPRCSGSMN